MASTPVLRRPVFPYVVQPVLNGSSAFLSFGINTGGTTCAGTIKYFVLSPDNIGKPGEPVTIQPSGATAVWQAMLLQTQATMLDEVVPAASPLVFSAKNAFLNQTVFMGLEQDSLGRLIWSSAPAGSESVASSLGLPAPLPPPEVSANQFSLQPVQNTYGNLYYGRASVVKNVTNTYELRAFTATTSPGMLWLAWRPVGSIDGLPVQVMNMYTATGQCAAVPPNPLVSTFLT